MYIFRNLNRIILDFIGGFIANYIVSYTPFWFMRKIFYQYILRISIHSMSFIQMGCYIYSSFGEFNIGNNTIINRNCILDRRGGLFIGSNVNISPEVAIFTAGHEINSPEFSYYTKRVLIDDYVWIGTRAMIMPGVSIGKGAVVLPGSVVAKDIKPFEIVAGVPAMHKGYRHEKLLYTLDWQPYFS